MTGAITTRNENGEPRGVGFLGVRRQEVVPLSGAAQPAKESDLEAWRHNELSPPSSMASTRRRFSFSKASFSAARKGQSHASRAGTLRGVGGA